MRNTSVCCAASNASPHLCKGLCASALRLPLSFDKMGVGYCLHLSSNEDDTICAIMTPSAGWGGSGGCDVCSRVFVGVSNDLYASFSEILTS